MTKKIINDKHALYLASVQDPLSDIERISIIYEELFSKKALKLREDFSAAFALSCCWVQSDKQRSAIAIDIDQPTIEYGRSNYLVNMCPDEQLRMDVRVANAIAQTDPVDIIATFNFSYCLIHERSELLSYFKKCYASLNQEGMLIIDNFGGSDSENLEIQETYVDNNDSLPPFIFQFERKSFNPINRRAQYAIHFLYPDGPQLIDAFNYDFRMWSIPEIRDLMKEAGFSKSKVYWEAPEDAPITKNDYYASEEEENTSSWNTYVVAIK